MKPLLLDFSVNRQEDEAPHYSYNAELNLNILQVNGRKIPFVESSINNVELQTKTEVKRERDDDMNCLLELESKTFVERERDDEEKSCIAELMTKTKVERERDDDNDFLYN